MKDFKYIVVFLFLFTVGLFAYRVTLSYFSDAGSSSNNVLSASAEFPTAAQTMTPTLPPEINSPTLTLTPAPGDVVINEINWAGNNDKSEDEWIELRNMTSQTVNLTGWKIENFGAGVGAGATITLATSSIGPNGYFLIAKYDENDSNSRLNVHADIIAPNPDISLLNTGEILSLISDLGTTIDMVNQNSGGWFAGVNTPEPKKSMERKDSPGSGTVSTNWQTATTHTGMDGVGATDEFGTPKNSNGI